MMKEKILQYFKDNDFTAPFDGEQVRDIFYNMQNTVEELQDINLDIVDNGCDADIMCTWGWRDHSIIVDWNVNLYVQTAEDFADELERLINIKDWIKNILFVNKMLPW